MAVILAAVPGLTKDDWLPEPGGVMGVEPAYGQIVFSALIPPETQTLILDEFDGEEIE
jgi:hypothetical protein